MKIGLISDVHGNAPALKEVLRDMGDVEAILHAGDVVGYNPYPSIVIQKFRELDVRSINGNHDRALIGSSGFGFNTLASQGLKWTEKELTKQDIEYLKSLDTEMDFLDGEIHVAHGAPGHPDRYLYPEGFSQDLLGDETVLVLGHTHIQGKSEFPEGTVVNPGSVGQPRDGDPRAGYALLDIDGMDVDLFRVEYPVDEVADKIRSVGLPERLASRLYDGR